MISIKTQNHTNDLSCINKVNISVTKTLLFDILTILKYHFFQYICNMSVNNIILL